VATDLTTGIAGSSICSGSSGAWGARRSLDQEDAAGAAEPTGATSGGAASSAGAD
jgi:hypothetical protein